jgi:hypothetical protein
MMIRIAYYDGSSMTYEILGFELESDTKHLVLQVLESGGSRSERINFPSVKTIENLEAIRG